jgi:coenzyme F420 biosynthesis associated uncharacterized protein
MVDWSLARQIARLATGSTPPVDLGVDLDALVADALEYVGGYTGLAAGDGVPKPEAVDRAAWTDANLTTLSTLIDPVAGRLDDRLGRAGPLAGPLRIAAGATLAAECGLVMSYMSQRVLGQFDLSLLQPEAPARLLFVAPNLERAIAGMGVQREPFLAWIAFHEVTHVLQFGGVPWLREHLGSALRAYLATVDVRIERGAAGGLPRLPDLQRIVETFREGGLAALVQTREQRGLMDRLQATMAVVEGYSEHVMDAIAAHALPGHAELRDAMERRRSTRSAPERVLMRLLGLEMKMRQYEVGKRFCDAVAERGGIELLNEVWRAPEALPTLRELDAPGAWADRIARERAAA